MQTSPSRDGNFEDDWKHNGDGTWTAEKGDGAETLAQDAGISREKAYKIMEEQGHGTYVDKKDGVTKSAVDPGDVVDVNSKEVTKIVAEETAKAEKFIVKNKSLNKQINKISKSIDSINKEIQVSKENQASSGSDGGSGTKGISFYFGLKVKEQKIIKSGFKNKRNELQKKLNNINEEY